MKNVLKASIAAYLLILAFAVGLTIVSADISNPHPVPPSNSVTTALLTQSAVTDYNIASSTGIQITKISGGTIPGGIPFNNGSALDYHSSLTYSSSTKVLQIVGGTIAETSTRFGGVGQTWPVAQCAINQVYQNDGNGNLSCANILSLHTAANYTADEPINQGDLVAIGDGSTVTENGSWVGGTSSGGPANSTTQWFALATTTNPTAVSIVSVSVSMRDSNVNGNNTGVTVSVESDNNGQPSGVVLASGSANYVFNNGCGGPTITLSSPYVYAGSKYYWFVFSFTNTAGENLHECNFSTSVFSEKDSSDSGTTWGATTTVTSMSETFNLSNIGHAYQASSLTTNFRFKNILGFAETAAATGASLYVDTSGMSTSPTSTTLGSSYFANDAKGTIGTSAGSQSRKVGTGFAAQGVLINVALQ
jgi:hypothetical protein